MFCSLIVHGKPLSKMLDVQGFRVLLTSLFRLHPVVCLVEVLHQPAGQTLTFVISLINWLIDWGRTPHNCSVQNSSKTLLFFCLLEYLMSWIKYWKAGFTGAFGDSREDSFVSQFTSLSSSSYVCACGRKIHNLFIIIFFTLMKKW